MDMLSFLYIASLFAIGGAAFSLKWTNITDIKKENSNGKTGTVYVRSVGTNQNGDEVLSYYRWLMMRKKKNGSKKVTGNRKKLDMDKDGKLTKKDFAMLRKKKK